MVSRLENFLAHWKGAVPYFQSHRTVTEELVSYDIFHCHLIVHWALRERLLRESWSVYGDRLWSLIITSGPSS